VYASRRHLPPKLRAMIDFLVATLREPEIPA
jgi:DNA-binding transcriptional LysR family regulator